MTPLSPLEHALPPELVSDWEALSARWQDSPLADWLPLLPEQFNMGLSPARYGDLPAGGTPSALCRRFRPLTYS